MPGMCNHARANEASVTSHLIDLLKQELVYNQRLKVLGLISYTVDDDPQERFFKVEFSYQRHSDSNSDDLSSIDCATERPFLCSHTSVDCSCVDNMNNEPIKLENGMLPVSSTDNANSGMYCCDSAGSNNDYEPPVIQCSPCDNIFTRINRSEVHNRVTNCTDFSAKVETDVGPINSSLECQSSSSILCSTEQGNAKRDRRKSRKPRRQLVPSYSSDDAVSPWQDNAESPDLLDTLESDVKPPLLMNGEDCANDILPNCDYQAELCNTSDESQSTTNNNNNNDMNGIEEDGANGVSSASEETEGMVEEGKMDIQSSPVGTTTTATLVGLSPQLANGLALLSQGTYNILPGPFSFISATPVGGGGSTLLKGMCTTVAAVGTTNRPARRSSSGSAVMTLSSHHPPSQVAISSSHALSKAYKCRYCGKVFNRKFCRERHERLHTGVKPYTCEICDEKFIRLEDKKRHVRSAHPSRGKANIV